jgi:hypothetical protein
MNYLITFKGRYFNGEYFSPHKSTARRYPESEIWLVHDRLFLDGIETKMIPETDSIAASAIDWSIA